MSFQLQVWHLKLPNDQVWIVLSSASWTWSSSTRDPRNIYFWPGWVKVVACKNATAHSIVFVISCLGNPLSHMRIREHLYLVEFKDFWKVNFVLKQNNKYFILHSFIQGSLESLTSPWCKIKMIRGSILLSTESFMSG